MADVSDAVSAVGSELPQVSALVSDGPSRSCTRCEAQFLQLQIASIKHEISVLRDAAMQTMMSQLISNDYANLFSKCRAWACSKTVNTEKTDPFAQFLDLKVIKFADKTFRFSEPIETIRAENSMTLLHAAAAAKDTSHKVKRLLDLGFPVDALDLAHRTPLFYAVREANLASVHMLLESGANSLATDWAGMTPLDYLPAVHSSTEVGASIRSALQSAAASAVRDPLLSSTALLKESYRCTCDATSHDMEAAFRRLSLSADESDPMSLRGKLDEALLQDQPWRSVGEMLCRTAFRFTTTEAYQLKTKLKSKTAKVDVGSLPADLTSVRFEESIAASLNFPYSGSPLHVAAWQGGPPIIHALLSLGFSTECRDIFGRTPLQVAAFSSNTAAVDALLDAGADPRAHDWLGNSVGAYAKAATKAKEKEAIFAAILRRYTAPAGLEPVPASSPVAASHSALVTPQKATPQPFAPIPAAPLTPFPRFAVTPCRSTATRPELPPMSSHTPSRHKYNFVLVCTDGRPIASGARDRQRVQIIAKLMDVADVSTFKGNWQERALQHFVEPGQTVLAQIGPLSPTELVTVKKRLTRGLTEGLQTQKCLADWGNEVPPGAPEWVTCPMQCGLEHCEFHAYKLVQALKSELGGVVSFLESGSADGESHGDDTPAQLSLSQELKCGSRMQLLQAMKDKGIVWRPPPEPIRRGTPAVTPRFSLRRAVITEESESDNKENQTSPVAPRRLFD